MRLEASQRLILESLYRSSKFDDLVLLSSLGVTVLDNSLGVIRICLGMSRVRYNVNQGCASLVTFTSYLPIQLG